MHKTGRNLSEVKQFRQKHYLSNITFFGKFCVEFNFWKIYVQLDLCTWQLQLIQHWIMINLNFKITFFPIFKINTKSLFSCRFLLYSWLIGIDSYAFMSIIDSLYLKSTFIELQMVKFLWFHFANKKNNFVNKTIFSDFWFFLAQKINLDQT